MASVERLPCDSQNMGDCFFSSQSCVVAQVHPVSASVVIGDLDGRGAEKVVAEVLKLGG